MLHFWKTYVLAVNLNNLLMQNAYTNLKECTDYTN